MTSKNPSSSAIASVLFDLDGTLLDTADDLGAALNYVLNHYGKMPVAAKDYRPIASDGALGLLNLGFGAEIMKYYVNNFLIIIKKILPRIPVCIQV